MQFPINPCNSWCYLNAVCGLSSSFAEAGSKSDPKRVGVLCHKLLFIQRKDSSAMEKGPFSIPPPMQLSTCGLLSTSETNGCSSATLFLLFDKCVPKSMLCITGDLDLPHQGFSKVVCFLCSSSPHFTVFFPTSLCSGPKKSLIICCYNKIGLRKQCHKKLKHLALLIGHWEPSHRTRMWFAEKQFIHGIPLQFKSHSKYDLLRHLYFIFWLFLYYITFACSMHVMFSLIAEAFIVIPILFYIVPLPVVLSLSIAVTL